MLEKVRTEYVDGTNLTYHDLVYAALKGMIDSLDPHSEFMDAEEYQELQRRHGRRSLADSAWWSP